MEFFDIVNIQNEPVGLKKLRAEVHRDGDWHRAISCWIINSSGELLLQQRTPWKETYPGLWDTSFAGHISAGEDSETTLVREGLEELGLSINFEEAKFLGVVRESYITNKGKFINNEFKDVYLIHRDFNISDLVFQPEEVSDAKWIKWQTLREILASKPQEFAPHESEYDLLFSYLESHHEN